MKAVEFDPSVGAQSGKGGRSCNVRHDGELGVALNSLQCSKAFQPMQGETREIGGNGESVYRASSAKGRPKPLSHLRYSARSRAELQKLGTFRLVERADCAPEPSDGVVRA